MCNLFPKEPGSWSNCVRKCLQDYDKKYCKLAYSGEGYNDTLCTFNPNFVLKLTKIWHSLCYGCLQKTVQVWVPNGCELNP